MDQKEKPNNRKTTDNKVVEPKKRTSPPKKAAKKEKKSIETTVKANREAPKPKVKLDRLAFKWNASTLKEIAELAEYNYQTIKPFKDAFTSRFDKVYSHHLIIKLAYAIWYYLCTGNDGKYAKYAYLKRYFSTEARFPEMVRFTSNRSMEKKQLKQMMSKADSVLKKEIPRRIKKIYEKVMQKNVKGDLDIFEEILKNRYNKEHLEKLRIVVETFAEEVGAVLTYNRKDDLPEPIRVYAKQPKTSRRLTLLMNGTSTGDTEEYVKNLLERVPKLISPHYNGEDKYEIVEGFIRELFFLLGRTDLVKDQTLLPKIEEAKRILGL